MWKTMPRLKGKLGHGKGYAEPLGLISDSNINMNINETKK